MARGAGHLDARAHLADAAEDPAPPRTARSRRLPDPKTIGPEERAFALGITIGRAANNDICLDHGSVSRFHAFLQLESSGQYLLYDADSSNGTLCEGMPVPQGRGAPLRDGTVISLGDVKLEFFTPARFEVVWLMTARR